MRYLVVLLFVFLQGCCAHPIAFPLHMTDGEHRLYCRRCYQLVGKVEQWAPRDTVADPWWHCEPPLSK